MAINFNSIAKLAKKALEKQNKTSSASDAVIAEKIKEKLNVAGYKDGGSAKKPGLYANIDAKRKRIAAGSGEKMRKPGTKGAPTAMAFKKSALMAKKPTKRS